MVAGIREDQQIGDGELFRIAISNQGRLRLPLGAHPLEWKVLMDASAEVKPVIELLDPEAVAAPITSIQPEDLEAYALGN